MKHNTALKTTRLLEKIYKSALKISSQQTGEDVYATIVKEALKLIGGKHGSLILQQDHDYKRVFATSARFFRFKTRKDGYVNQAIRSNSIAVVTPEKFQKIHAETKHTRFTSSIIIPLSFRKKAVGALTIITNKKIVSKADKDILRLFGPLATLAIKNAQFFEEMTNAIETRDLFISLASHELKTPLTTINVYSQLIKKKTELRQPIEKKWVEPLLNEITRLARLINELLQVNHVKKGSLLYDWKECSVQEIVSRAITDFKISNSNYKVIYKNEIQNSNDKIWADYDKIIQVIMNILNNASKFSSPHSKIIISTKSLGNTLSISITDHGKGISPDEITHIFDRFYRAESAHKQGMGLGLYLSKQIIDVHKGAIRVNSQLGQGTTFTITLPALT